MSPGRSRGGVAVLPYGDRALLVEVGGTDQVLAWVDALADLAPRGVADVVPAAQTVLVVAEDGADLPGLRAALAAVTPSPGAGASAAGEVLEVPVVYDGPDLEEVARLTGLAPDAVVRAHAAETWRVAFGGFVPGFGYLVGGDPRLHVPRRDVPRTAVPPGAVALAGPYTGVYPRESPGGWQLIGRTDLALWDPDRDPPALLRPGTRVRFVAR